MSYLFSSCKVGSFFYFIFVICTLAPLHVSAVEQGAVDKDELSVGISFYKQGKHEAAILEWEKVWGIIPKKTEPIHHIDLDRRNSDIKNLYLFD